MQVWIMQVMQVVALTFLTSLMMISALNKKSAVRVGHHNRKHASVISEIHYPALKMPSVVTN